MEEWEADSIMNQAHKIVYLDNNATTRVAPEVVETMLPYLRDRWGNPSSAYAFGKQLAKDIEEAREKVAALIQADPREVVFTSCGTESNNSAIQSTLALNPGKRHVVSSSVEHSSVINHCELLETKGVEVTYLPVESDGSLDIHLLEQSIRPDTAIVSLMWANNETGVLFPIEEIAAICRSKEVPLHTDAVQVAGKLPVDFKYHARRRFSIAFSPQTSRPQGSGSPVHPATHSLPALHHRRQPGKRTTCGDRERGANRRFWARGRIGVGKFEGGRYPRARFAGPNGTLNFRSHPQLPSQRIEGRASLQYLEYRV